MMAFTRSAYAPAAGRKVARAVLADAAFVQICPARLLRRSLMADLST